MAKNEIDLDTDSLPKLITEKYGGNPEKLIMILQDISAQYNYLPQEALFLVSETLGVPLSEIYSVAKFYKAFSLEPRGKYVVNVCTGTACHVRGAEKIMEALQDKLNIAEGKTTEDRLFTLQAVRCVGCCASGPVITVNEQTHGALDRSNAVKLIDKYEKDAT